MTRTKPVFTYLRAKKREFVSYVASVCTQNIFTPKREFACDTSSKDEAQTKKNCAHKERTIEKIRSYDKYK